MCARPTEAILTDEASIPAVVSALTLVEKAMLCGGATAFETHAIERFAIPTLTMADGHNGVNIFHLFGNYVPHAAARADLDLGRAQIAQGKLRLAELPGLKALIRGDLEDPSVAPLVPDHEEFLIALVDELKAEFPDEQGLPSCFPPGIVMSATWDLELAAEYGAAVAAEASAFGMDILLGPNVNIHRDPLGGRVFESYSEDPFQTSRVAVAYIKGVQSEGVAAVVKHYVANNQEYERQGITATISERALREIYYPAFKASVQEGRSWMVMSAYNGVNGTPCAMNPHLLNEVLRGEWGFNGFVVSDWGGAYDRVAALKAGNDLEMPGPCDPQALVDAVGRGELEESMLDGRISNYLRIALRLPAFGKEKRPAIDRARSSAIARKCATDGIVLLKNDDRTLPHPSGKIAVFGENARDPIATGGGSAMVYSPYTVSLLEGLSSRFGDDNTQYGQLGRETSLSVVSVGVRSGEGWDRSTMDLNPEDVELIRDVAARSRQDGIRCVVVLNVCGPVEMATWIDEVDAVVLVWLGGQEIGHAVSDVLSGDVCPSGKLPITFPRRYDDTPARLNFPGEFGEVRYGEGIFVGYRYYDTVGIAPQFEFGYGLSFTRFVLRDMQLSAVTMTANAGERLSVEVILENAGDVSGAEVVQLYVRDLHSTVQKAHKELKGFRKVVVRPNVSVSVKFEISDDAFAHYDTQKGSWCIEPGLFEIMIGVSSRDIRCVEQIRIVGDNPYSYDMSTPIWRILNTASTAEILSRYLPAEALSDPHVAEIMDFIPNVSFERVWTQHYIPYLNDLSPEKVEGLRGKIIAEFKRVQID